MTDTGPDISGYQAGVDGRAVVHAGHHFEMIKATEGTGYVNPALSAQVASARAAGLPIGLYHFVDPGNGPAQGAHFVSVAAPLLRPGDLGLWVDFESGSHDDLHAILTAVDKVQPHNHGGIYTGEWYWGPHGSPSCADCGSRNLWLSGYTAQQPPTPAPWRSTAMWQFTDRDTSVTGYSLDMSTTNVLAQLIGTTPTPGDFLMALTDQQQTDVYDRVAALLNLFDVGPGVTKGECTQNLRDVRVAVGNLQNNLVPAAILAAQTGGKPVDVAALAQQIAALLPAADVAALASQLAVVPKV